MKNLRSLFGFGGLAFVILTGTIGCCPEDDGTTVETNSFGSTEDEEAPFLKAEQECVQVVNNTSNSWCRQHVDEDFVAYFCAREPPEVLMAVPLDDRDNMYCGCTPASGWEACPYNINRDR